MARVRDCLLGIRLTKEEYIKYLKEQRKSGYKHADFIMYLIDIKNKYNSKEN